MVLAGAGQFGRFSKRSGLAMRAVPGSPGLACGSSSLLPFFKCSSGSARLVSAFYYIDH